MVREYEMTGTMPIIVGGYGRVEPGSKNFTCEMEPAQEAFFVKIRAVRVVADRPDAKHEPLPPVPVGDGIIEFEGQRLTHVPSGWPIRPDEVEEEG